MIIPKIVLKNIGYSNSILIINGSNSILIDTGVKAYLYRFKNLFRQYNLKPTDIKLIILTHTHYDHTGNLKELVKLTGAKVLVHINEFENLKNGFIQIPKGISLRTRIISKIGRIIYPKYASSKPFVSDFINEDDFDLSNWGIDGKVISTPGHTNGSQAVLLGQKLISGDTFINLKNGTIFPHFADDPKTLLKTWQQLFKLEIDEIYPGHGSKMKIEKVFPEFEKWKEKIID
ncbi:MAG: MBL fold metallo-hydrolase [Prolixibacteraceae bacterium]|jgi:hydroxyacylglutathione hydrolase|nr:MBL fold metallo-hydrolase [Prolixibacteraceae bacterium]MBT6004867.1 MBL fold metallo-hydrolase [Prolixibacteraceae bacterium]MBT6763929.1 MBL fold metallo-hydrolase [Prolixibacteraceae bacterium]MBT6998101.1 MBL fold metallo-hydrolase [Prolixibacteraceae bacterium]MBT7394625.1 MBL fold metallo-hydrolase [Prolixibacteraceae bacterium]